MRKTLSLLLASTITLTACGAVRESRINPFNWFGQSRSESVQTKQNTNPLIPEKSGGVFAGMRAKDAEYLGLPFDQVTYHESSDLALQHRFWRLCLVVDRPGGASWGDDPRSRRGPGRTLHQEASPCGLRGLEAKGAAQAILGRPSRELSEAPPAQH